MRFMSYAAAASLAAAFTITTAQAADISGAGATFPYPIYAKWADTYKKDTGIGLNYQSIGSGGGIKQIEGQDRDVRRHRQAARAKELVDNGLVQFPMVMGGIVPVINVEGVKAGEVVLDGPTLANIFLGAIPNGTMPRSRSSIRMSSFPLPPSRSCIAPMDRAPPSTSPTTSPR